MARDIEIDLAARSRKLSMDERDVLLFHSPVLEGAPEPRVSFVVFGNDQKAGGLLIDAVDDSGPALRAAGREIGKMEQQRMNNRLISGS
jgi:hypothetical protein